ncbi:MAG: class I adenylate-forming enzyme family protein [Xanthobacteraceae bacterium]
MTGKNGAAATVVDRIKRDFKVINLGIFFDEALGQHPDRIAIVDLTEAAPRYHTYVELEAEVCRATQALAAAGLRKKDRCIVSLPNGVTFLSVFLGALRLGVVPVPINFWLGADTLQSIMRDARCRAIVGSSEDTATCCDIADKLDIAIRLSSDDVRPGWGDYRALAVRQSETRIVEPMAFDDVAFQPYTSGSTGTPKGIALTHGGMIWGIEHSQKYWPLSPSDRVIVAAPMFHKNAMRGSVKPSLRAGASLVIMRNFDPRRYLQAVADHKVTSCSGVPTMFAEMLRHSDLVQSLDFSALKRISMGSAIVPPELIDRLMEAFKITVRESFGLTEGGGAIRQPIDGRVPPRGSVGMVAPELEVKLVGPDGREADEGECWIRSPYVLREYVNLPELSRERIRDGWLRTGDLLRRDADGFYYYVTRIDDMFVCGGENIYPKEVENLALKHPDVANVAVAPLTHDTKGYAPAAMVVLKTGRRVEEQDLQNFFAANGPAFAIPRAIMFVDSIPLNGAGKVDRALIRRTMEERFGTLQSRGLGRS